MENIRKNILRVHGTLLIVAGIVASIYSTIGMMNGVGFFKFLQTDKIGHIGFFQAYMLAALLGVVLLMGSRQENVRKWNRIGALIHAIIFVVYVIHWNFFSTIEGGEIVLNIGIVFHLVMLSVESYAGFISKK